MCGKIDSLILLRPQRDMMGIGDKVDVLKFLNVEIDDVARTATFHPAT